MKKLIASFVLLTALLGIHLNGAVHTPVNHTLAYDEGFPLLAPKYLAYDEGFPLVIKQI